jgi:glycosidase
LKLAAVLQYTVYGVPSVFYGDEVGMEGHHDPFCRRPYPWGRDDGELLAHYRLLGALRREQAVLADGIFSLLFAKERRIAYTRGEGKERLTVIVNASEQPFAYPAVPASMDLLTSTPYSGTVSAYGAVILKATEE